MNNGLEEQFKKDYGCEWIKNINQDESFNIDNIYETVNSEGNPVIGYKDLYGNEKQLYYSGYEDVLINYIIPIMNNEKHVLDTEDEKIREHIKEGIDYYMCSNKYSKLLRQCWKDIEEDFLSNPDNERGSSISENFLMPVEFIKKYEQYLEWYRLSSNPGIPESFFRENLDKVEWGELSSNPNLSGKFFMEHIKKVDWRNLCLNPGLGDEFFEDLITKYPNKIVWGSISSNTGLSPYFFMKYKNMLSEYQALGNYSMPEPIIKEFTEKRLESNQRISSLGTNIGVSEKFLKPLKKYIENTDLYKNSNLSSDYLLSLQEGDVNKKNLFANPAIDKSFIKNYTEKTNFIIGMILLNPSLSLDWITKNIGEDITGFRFKNPFLYINNYKERKMMKAQLKWVMFDYNSSFTYYNCGGSYNPSNYIILDLVPQEECNVMPYSKKDKMERGLGEEGLSKGGLGEGLSKGLSKGLNKEWTRGGRWGLLQRNAPPPSFREKI